MALMEEKYKEWLLETIDLLRQRKARPDIVRISRMLERYHGVTLKETRTCLESLVSDGKVIKVHFNGGASYRRPGKGSDEPNDTTKTSNYNHSTSNRITQAIKTITQQTGDGVTFAELERWLISKNPDTRLVKLRLHTAILREMDAHNVTKLSDNCFVLTESLPKSENTKELKPNSVSTKPAARNKPSKSMSEPGSYKDNNSEMSEKVINKRGRPLSKRKKIKKTHGPDFENPLKVRITNKENKSEEPTCDFCSSAAKMNKQGVPEQLLSCKECNAKVHPSCMDYSEKLAQRALNSPWQCMDCKTCCVCDGEGNDGLIVFCDECDKGYHLSCHTPQLASNPKGTWVCCACKLLSGEDSQEKTTNKHLQKRDIVSEGEEENGKKGGKRKLSRQKSSPPEFKRQKSKSIPPDSSGKNGVILNCSTAGTEGAPCLPTPTASPRPSDTFDYEMKMSLLGKSLSITEDNTVYSDASKWDIDNVVEFFRKNGHDEQAQIFQDQEIDGPSLLLLKREDVLTALGLKLGPALKIYQKILKLQNCSQSVSVL